MKVMLVNECPIRLSGSGGTEKHVQQLLEALSQQGHEIVLLTSQLNGQPEVQTPGVYAIPHLNAPPLRKKIFHHLREQSNALRKTAEIVRRESPDVIHIHNLMNPKALKLFRSLRPTVKSIHDCRPFCTKPYPVVASRLVGNSEVLCNRRFDLGCWSRCYLHAGEKLIDRLEAWSYFPSNLRALREILACDRLVVYSRYTQQLAIRQGVNESRIDLLYLFTETGDLDLKTPIQREYPPLIVFAGRLSPEKGVRHLLEAVESLPCDLPFRLVIAGDGPMKKDIEQRAGALRSRIRIELPGFLHHETLLDLYRRAAFVVVPSIGSEGFSLVGIEAMNCSTPAVGFNVGGVGEWLVDRQTGLSVPRGDIQGLKDALEFMLRHPTERELMGCKAQAFVQAKFRRDTHIDGLIESYRQATKARTTAASQHIHENERTNPV
ncbi:MAG: hypothetical protein A2X46_05635 [Lentisphaerae bacterium GWF2_57_35]|nr:MAG: hypothetical protein A2X46_05635 [Lentisphaerae bacterium GWF2_57_35]